MASNRCELNLEQLEAMQAGTKTGTVEYRSEIVLNAPLSIDTSKGIVLYLRTTGKLLATAQLAIQLDHHDNTR